ncbi:tripeptidyl peptidase A [Cristinia sonorae]|uniref:Tripeptidyl peptidase A n=1 Tax=Cristinia sonorae TaxID=1940300 RepID=A0A8K0XLF0_9AGAR|nr:tripeptidyl peptidase A [Cristinia sonorae]
MVIKLTVRGVILALSFSSLVAAIPSKFTAHRVKDATPSPREWVKRSRAPADASIELRITLPLDNWEVVERHITEVSDPYHARYGQHLSVEEIRELNTPHQDSVDAVTEWLAAHGLHGDLLQRSTAGDSFKVKVPVSVAEKLMKTEYHVWEHSDSGELTIRTTEYSVPSSVHEHIDFIQPTTLFSSPPTPRSISKRTGALFRKVNDTTLPVSALSAPSSGLYPACDVSKNAPCGDFPGCNVAVSPACIQQLYNMAGIKGSASSGNGIGFASFQDITPLRENYRIFFETYFPSAGAPTPWEVILVNGGRDTQNWSHPAYETLAQYGFGLTHPTPATVWSTGGEGPVKNTEDEETDPWLEYLDYVLSHPNPPPTIMIYSMTGIHEQNIPKEYAQRVCRQFGQLGARGVSVVYPSSETSLGDASDDPNNTICRSNDGTNKRKFLPRFPATCPYVTVVGKTVGIPESPDFVWPGSTGFSEYFKRPLYQELAVSSYLKNHVTKGAYSGMYNQAGRAYPDVAALGSWFEYVFHNETGWITSSSSNTAALFGAVVSNLNTVRLSKKLPPLGFLNPLLYAIGALYPKAFNDMTTGNIPGCGTPGFNASKGWDPLTGFGSPNFGVLKDIVSFPFNFDVKSEELGSL